MRPTVANGKFIYCSAFLPHPLKTKQNKTRDSPNIVLQSVERLIRIQTPPDSRKQCPNLYRVEGVWSFVIQGGERGRGEDQFVSNWRLINTIRALFFSLAFLLCFPTHPD